MPVDVPKFIQENARRGLKYYADGKGGDGLVPATIREARDMAKGYISKNKPKKMSLQPGPNQEQAKYSPHRSFGTGTNRCRRSKADSDRTQAKPEADRRRRGQTVRKLVVN